LEVIAAIERANGLALTYDAFPRRAGDPVCLSSGNGRARNLLDREPRYGLDDIVASAWVWHSRHVDGYGD
jgi:UDP-glucose 4-epimerase